MRIAIVLKKLRVSLMGFCFDLVQKLKQQQQQQNVERHDNSSQDHAGLGDHSLG